MSKAQEMLKAIHIFNGYGLVGKGGVFICYCAAEPRTCQCSHWAVCRPGDKLSDVWYDHGSKTFTVSGRADKPIVLREAMRWASKRYNIHDWARDPFGNYVSKVVLDAAMAKAKLAQIAMTENDQ